MAFKFSSPTKFIVALSNLLIWISSIIVVGITGYFLKVYPHSQHLIFEIVIAALTLGLWLPSFILPFFTTYKPYFYGIPNFIFSYLWLTSFIFAAQDYNESNCFFNAPRRGSCNLKRTSEAFIFLAFFFSLVSFAADVWAWRALAVAKATPVAEEKFRPAAGTEAVATAPAPATV